MGAPGSHISFALAALGRGGRLRRGVPGMAALTLAPSLVPSDLVSNAKVQCPAARRR
jgi:hypothetical protein